MSSIPFRVAIPNSEMKPMMAGILTSPVVMSRANTPPINASGRLIRMMALLLHTAEFMVEEQEYHHDGHERSKCQRAACCLFAFELSAVFDVVSFGQFDLCVYLGSVYH